MRPAPVPRCFSAVRTSDGGPAISGEGKYSKNSPENKIVVASYRKFYFVSITVVFTEKGLYKSC